MKIKQYQMPQLLAKNSPRGSYAAGCPLGVMTRFSWFEDLQYTILENGERTKHTCKDILVLCKACEKIA